MTVKTKEKGKIKPIILSCELDNEAGEDVLRIRKKHSLSKDTRKAFRTAALKYSKKLSR